MHEVFEHTADLGLRIRCGTLAELFGEAGTALFELMVENMSDVKPLIHRGLRIEQPERELLFFDWLNELLYLSDCEQLVLCQFAVRINHTLLEATVWGEPRDKARHQLDHEVKAITYHQLKLQQEPDGQWLAEVILDI
ncbi:MAG TPA: archease [Gemmatales bacterium]|nr:archease [Gemmatales bacterium]